MNEEQRKHEDSDYKSADNWLRLHGKFEVFPFKEKALFKVVFTDKNGTTEETGEDLVKLTIQIYNAVKS
jgi:hypothetical protein